MTAASSRPEAIANEVRRKIVTGHHQPGERLPSERELAERAGVNRGSAREAMKILANERLVDVRPGGARVAPLHQANVDVLGHVLAMPGPPDPVLVGQLLDVHELLLVGAARLAAERADDEEVAEALELLSQLTRRGLSEDDYLRALASLLQLIARASRNLVLHMVGNSLHVVLAGVVPLLRRVRPPAAKVAPSIEVIRDALVRRNPEQAEQGVRAFLRIKREYVLAQLAQAA